MGYLEAIGYLASLASLGPRITCEEISDYIDYPNSTLEIEKKCIINLGKLSFFTIVLVGKYGINSELELEYKAFGSKRREMHKRSYKIQKQKKYKNLTINLESDLFQTKEIEYIITREISHLLDRNEGITIRNENGIITVENENQHLVRDYLIKLPVEYSIEKIKPLFGTITRVYYPPSGGLTIYVDIPAQSGHRSGSVVIDTNQ